jgi:hypothetical protein
MSGFDVFLKRFSCCKLEETEVRGLESAYNAGLERAAVRAESFQHIRGQVFANVIRKEVNSDNL